MPNKLIILAAGQGTRLRPLTDDRPKCMVELRGRPLIDQQIEAAKNAGIDEIHAVVGYRHDMIRDDIAKHVNERFATTNMVESLFVAEKIMSGGDVVISYGDIVYQPDVMRRLLQAKGDVSVVVDLDWHQYWSARMDDPLADAETMKLRDDGTIIELGKKPVGMDDIHGQYIGLIKFSETALPKIREFYHGLDRSAIYDGKDFDNMYMTTFLQSIADQLTPIYSVPIKNGWMEVDCPEDLVHTDFLDHAGKL